MHGKSIIVGAILYTIVSLFILYAITPHSLFTQHLHLFYKDPSAAERIHTAIVQDLNGNHAIIARLFENKASFAVDNILLSLSRTTDPTFFFSLSAYTYFGHSYYTFFPAIFFPFFLIGSILLMRKWHKVHKKYFFLLPLLGISLLIDVLFIPYTASLKLIPLLISVQLITFLGIAEMIQSVIPGLTRNLKRKDPASSAGHNA